MRKTGKEKEVLRRLISSVGSRFPGHDVLSKKRILLGLLVTRVRESQGLSQDVVWLKLGLKKEAISRLEKGSANQERSDIDSIIDFYGFISPLRRYLIRLMIYDCFPSVNDNPNRLRQSLPPDLIPRFREAITLPTRARRKRRKVARPRIRHRVRLRVRAVQR